MFLLRAIEIRLNREMPYILDKDSWTLVEE